MGFHSPLIRSAISWGGGIVPLDSHDNGISTTYPSTGDRRISEPSRVRGEESGGRLEKVLKFS